MKVLYLDTTLSLSLIPRIYPEEGDTLILKLRNEISNLELTPEFTFSITDKLNLTITSQPDDFKTQNKYEIEILNGIVTIYLGKLLILEENTNVQNYEYGSQSNARFDYK